MTVGTSNKVIVAGLGNLGRRHYEALLNLENNFELYAFDIMEPALHACRQLGAERKMYAGPERILHYCNQMPQNEHFEFAVIASCADVRLDVLKNLLLSNSVSNVLLEKVLFQKVEDFLEAGDLIAEHNSNAWVNCPRRVSTIYTAARDFLAGDEPLDMSVTGSDWGFACNSIHFIDLFAYFVPEGELCLAEIKLAGAPFEGKRRGFWEANGKSLFTKGDSNLAINCESIGQNLLVSLLSGQKAIDIDETAGVAIFKENQEVVMKQSFRFKFQSEMTGHQYLDCLQTGKMHLTPFAESAALHIPFLEGLRLEMQSGLGVTLDRCPIT